MLTPWKVLSHDAEVILPHDLEKKTTQGRRKRGGNGSFSGKCLDQRLCLLFLLKCPGLEIPGLISFRMDCLDLLAVQGTLKSLLQHHSSKASILWRSAFFTVQLSHPYMTNGKTIALTRRTFVSNDSAF